MYIAVDSVDLGKPGNSVNLKIVSRLPCSIEMGRCALEHNEEARTIAGNAYTFANAVSHLDAMHEYQAYVLRASMHNPAQVSNEGNPGISATS